MQINDNNDKDSSNEPTAANPDNNGWDHNSGPMTAAFNAARSYQDPSSYRNGLLYRFGASNARPEAKAFRQLSKLRARIESILNNVAASIQGNPIHPAQIESCSAYEDFFEKGHDEEHQFGNTKLLIEVKFKIPGSLKLVIRNLTAEAATKAAKAAEKDNGPRFQAPPSERGFDSLVNLGYDPRRDSFHGQPVTALLSGNEHTMMEIMQPIAMFSDANALDFYVQGMRTDRLVYVFLDQDQR